MSKQPLSLHEIETLLILRQFDRCQCTLDVDGALGVQLELGEKVLTVAGINRQELCDEQAVYELGDALLEEMNLLEFQPPLPGEDLKPARWIRHA
ncbi:DUF1652 domain-containing protein [Pseudomonas sp. UL073]|uniref:DUF1652 domain-containing protein n=1 Tax=Zestomonas insulae TaxID=2809017 RepID=A0ABS2IFQ1_9GAMM|nr:DUF1652 domain-containing protein [Pseudomonas insulae]MBM7061916.1 DUF1652 domain-containing protein [Pseudomonas insulae]